MIKYKNIRDVESQQELLKYQKTIAELRIRQQINDIRSFSWLNRERSGNTLAKKAFVYIANKIFS